MTMVLFSSIPIPSAKPPKVMMLKVSPKAAIKAAIKMEVISTAMGMALPIIRVRRRLPRNR